MALPALFVTALLTANVIAVKPTLVCEGLDSLIFITLAFVVVFPSDALMTAIVTQWLLKSAYEALATPLTYAVVNGLKRLEGVDVYDRGTDFSPFALGRWSADY